MQAPYCGGFSCCGNRPSAHTHRKIKKREKVRGKERGGNGVAACPGQVKELVWDLGGDRCRTIAQECEETPGHLSASLKSR